jgi:hypothetical protein
LRDEQQQEREAQAAVQSGMFPGVGGRVYDHTPTEPEGGQPLDGDEEDAPAVLE